MISVEMCDGRKTEKDQSLHDLARQVGKNGKGDRHVVWVDISAPTEEDWQTLADTFHFHPLAIEDARNRFQRAKVDQYDGYLFLSIHAWAGEVNVTDDLHDAAREIDIFLGPNYIVTIHDEQCAALTETRRRWETHPEKLPEAHGTPAYLLYLLLDAVVDDYFPAVDQMDTTIDDIETAVYASSEDKKGTSLDLKPALRMKKQLLLLRQTIAPMRDVLNALLRIDDDTLIPATLPVYLQDVYDHTLRLVEQVDLHRDILTGAMDAMMAQTSNRLNQTMKTMTGASIILMIDALIAGVYGMNFVNMPELHAPNGYFYTLGSMAFLTIILIGYFRRIKWF